MTVIAPRRAYTCMMDPWTWCNLWACALGMGIGSIVSEGVVYYYSPDNLWSLLFLTFGVVLLPVSWFMFERRQRVRILYFDKIVISL